LHCFDGARRVLYVIETAFLAGFESHSLRQKLGRIRPDWRDYLHPKATLRANIPGNSLSQSGNPQRGGFIQSSTQVS
ncbi:MAG TPA: hypothetical protein VLT90_03715, partial [Terriglobales bacterium]|nr:hypothetical protein [Terriglobales bacterium]